MGNIFGHFPRSLIPVAFSQQRKVKVLRCSGVLSLNYGLAAAAAADGGGGGGGGRVVGEFGLQSLKNQF